MRNYAWRKVNIAEHPNLDGKITSMNILSYKVFVGMNI